MEALDFKCPNCSAMLPFNPKTQKWDCEYCGKSYTLDELKTFKKEDEESRSETINATLYNCPNCGAKVMTDENTVATFCVYCGSTNIIKERIEDELKPKAIIPFKTTKDEAITAFKKFKRGKIFAPKDFSNPKNIDKITGVYIPFWLYDAHASGRVIYKAKRKKEWRDGNYVYTRVENFDVVRDGDMDFKRVPVDGSTKFDNDTMDSLEPFDYLDLKEFDMSYLSGFLAEKYDIDKDEAYKRAEYRMENSFEDRFKKTVEGYDSVEVGSKEINIEEKDSWYVLLPVWMLNIKYNDKMHLFALNGQTGEMIGDIPIDKKRRFTISLTVFLTIFVIVTVLLTIF